MASLTYCVKCKKKTKDVAPKIVTSGGRSRRVSKCAVCGTMKSVFVKSQKGGNPAAAIAGLVGQVAPGIISGISSGIQNLQQNTGVYDREKMRKDMKLFDDMTMNYYISAKKDGNPILAGQAREMARQTLANRGIYV